MKTTICLAGMLVALAAPVSAALYSYNTPTAIPDFNTLGTGSSLQFNVSGEGSSLSALTLTFDLQGGAATDLSGYLRLGNEISSPYYNLTTLIQSQSLSPGTPTSYSINFTDVGFQGAFNAVNPNGTWTLFFEDGVNGDQTTVNGWSLDVTAVPEPVNVALAIFGGVVAVWGAGRRIKAGAAGTINPNN